MPTKQSVQEQVNFGQHTVKAARDLVAIYKGALRRAELGERGPVDERHFEELRAGVARVSQLLEEELAAFERAQAERDVLMVRGAA